MPKNYISSSKNVDCISFTVISCLMLFRGPAAVYSENGRQTLKYVELLNIGTCGIVTIML
jgi:hypothetical protein